MSNLDTRTGSITGVIRKDRDLTDKEIELFNYFVSSLLGDYFYIVHDKDIDENGSLKHKHIHFVLRLNGRYRLSTILNKLCDCLGFTNSNGIEVSKTVNFVGSIQYLTHKNDKDKYSYSSDLICTNINRNELETLLSMSAKGIDTDYLITLVQTSNSILDVISTLGLNYYTPYRATIRDIWEATHK